MRWGIVLRVLGWGFVLGALFSPAVWPAMRGALFMLGVFLEYRSLRRRTGLSFSTFKPQLLGGDRDY